MKTMRQFDPNNPLDVWAKEECERCGGLPTPEEILAFHQQREVLKRRLITCGGDLSLLDPSFLADDAGLDEIPFPTEGAEPGDPDFASRKEADAALRRIKLQLAWKRVRRWLPWILAALIVSALIALAVYDERRDENRLQSARAEAFNAGASYVVREQIARQSDSEYAIPLFVPRLPEGNQYPAGILPPFGTMCLDSHDPWSGQPKPYRLPASYPTDGGWLIVCFDSYRR